MVKQELLDRIELFLNGKLQGEELKGMEELVKTNPEVKSEVALQKAIVKAIKVNRRMALKARLNNIQIPTGSLSNPGFMGSKFFALKIASVILATTSSIGLGYYFLNKPVEIRTSVNEKIDTKTATVIIDSAILADSENELVTVNPDIEKENEQSEKQASIEKLDPKTTVSNLKRTSTKTVTTQRTAVADGEKMLDRQFEESSETDVKIDAETLKVVPTKEENVKAADIDIKNFPDDKYKFHYKLTNDILYLYGMFDKSPYEILEFNENKVQALYLYYNKSFFALKKGDSVITRLKRISDKDLIKDLMDAREKKH